MHIKKTLFFLGIIFLFFLKGLSVAADEPVLIGHWNFESSLNVADIQGNFPNATVAGGVSWNSGMQAAYFNGTNGYLRLYAPETVDLRDGCVIEARVYITPDPWSKIIFGGYFGGIAYNFTGQYFGYNRRGAWAQLNYYNMPCNDWKIVKAVRHGGMLSVYVDGVELTNMDDPQLEQQPGQDNYEFYIGNFPGFNWYFKGYIQWVKLYTFTPEKDRDEWLEDIQPVYYPSKTAKIEKVSGNPGMLFDDDPIPGSTGYCGYLFTKHGFTGEHMNPSEAFHIQHLAELANAGVNIHQLEIMIDLPDGIINFSEADDVATEILAHQSDAKFLLRVGFKAGNKFADKYPNDVVKFEDGEKTAYWTQPTQAYHPQDNPEPRYSLASHKFERKAAEGLVNLAEALSTKPYKDSVIGAIIGAGTCSQWLWWGDFDYENHCIDFSDVMLERFKEYLQEKYVTVDALRTAWNNSSVTFDTITIPTKAERGSDMPNSLNDIPPVQYDEGQFGYFRNPGVGNNQRVVDYYISMSRELGRRMIYLCETFKKATDKKLLVGAFYGPTAILGYKIEGQSYFDEVLASEWIDFWLDPWSYQGRWEGEPLFINAPMGSLLLHNKTYLIEADLRTSELGRREFGAPKDAWGDLMMFRKSFIRSVTNGAYSYWFEMEFDGWFENDKIFQGIDEASKISTLAMSLDRTRNTEIAVIYDGASLLYASDWLDYIALVRQTIQGLGYMGADYETFSTMDISNPIMSNYKFFIFPNAFALSQSTRDAIDTYLKRDGNVILWVYAPGLINTDSSTLSVANMSSLTGMSFNYLTGRRDIAMEVTQAGDITENLPIGYEFGDFLRPTTSHNYPPENPYLAAPIQTYPQFYVEDVSADTFAIFSDTGKSGLAVKEFNDWTSVYCGTIAVPSSILRNIAKKAGVHLYTDTDDIINTNNSFLGMHTATEGAKQIRLPARMDVYDMFSKRLMGKDIDRFDVSVPIHSSILFFTGDYDAALGILGPPSETGNKLDISATAGGSVEAPGEGEFYYYETNQQVNLVAEAADGYYFVNWTGDTDKIVNVNAASTTITMDGNYTITANFVQDNTHSLTVSTSTGGNVETPGLGVYYYNNGTEVNIKAVASAGYHFVKWTGNTGTIVNVDSAETKITMNGNYNITATFAKNTHTLTISSGTGGSISTPGAGTYQYDYGTVVPIKAVANTGYHFVAWTGDTGKIANVNSAETSITMNGNYTITATFAKNTHTLTISSGTSGSISTPGAGTYQYDYGTVVPIKAVANTGYHFVAWTGDTGKIANVNSAETTITMEGNYTITATFAKNAQTLTISSGTGGSISTPGAGTYQYDYGTVVPIKAVANTGYHFVAWTGDTGKIANVYSAETTITMEGNYSITATFEQDAPVQYTLTISSGTGGSISAPGSGTYQYDYGTVVPIKAIAAGGYNFDKWTGDTGKISNINSAETTITMEGDYNITATFASGLGYLIGHWNFESGLNVADLKEIFPNGTVVGGLTWDVSWQAALFNGTNSYIKIDVPENINLMDGCVIEARVYMTGGTWGQSILGGYFGAIGYNLCVPYFGYTKGPWATLNYSLPSNQWVTVKGVRYNGYLQVYINGALIAQMTDPNLTPQNPIIRRQFQIGGIPDWGSDWYFKGYIKWVKLYTFDTSMQPTIYGLTISAGTGGNISTPGVGTNYYEQGTSVSIKAVADTGYHFVAWTGDTGKIANVNSAETSITMEGNYSITATFEQDTPVKRTLTINAETGKGSITLPASGAGTYQYDYGTVVPIKAVANTGYHFVAWTGDTGKIANVYSAETTITMEGNYTITATFAKNAQTLTISSGTGGSISTPGSGTYQYDYGTVVPIKAVANTGYHFVAWTGDTGKIANVNSAETTITMNGNYTITATFAKTKHTLTISAGLGGSITAPATSPSNYDYGTEVNIKAVASAGYHFVKWTGDTGKIDNVNSAETKITMNGNYSITATFEQDAPVQYTLTISAGTGGTATPAGTNYYNNGTEVNIKAVASTGYHFVKWTGNTGTIVNVNSAETTITMEGNYTITATFAKNTHTLTISSGTGGSISTPGSGTYQYDYGTVVPIKAVANTGYHFVAWTGDTGKIANVNSAETTITMNGNYTITATFAKNTHTLTISSGTGGSISTPGSGTYQYDYGTVVPIKAVADTGYHFVAWTGDTGKIANVNSAETTITMEGNYTITATFAKNAQTLTISSGTGGSISTPGAGTYQYDYGTVVPIKAVANTGYHFVAWTGNTGTIANTSAAETTITMNGNYTITATFAIDAGGTQTLNISAGTGGKITTPAAGVHTYNSGAVISIKATPSAGYLFVAWIGDTATIANVNSAETTITMEGNYSITATFAKTTQTLKLLKGTGCSSTTPTASITYTYSYGAIVPIKAVPLTGYDFVAWTGAINTVADPYSAETTVTMLGSYTITATFAKTKHTLTISAGPGGSITVPGSGTYQYDYGTSVSIRAVADTGYQFLAWTGDVERITSGTSTSTYIKMEGNYTITATFVKKTYTLSMYNKTGGYSLSPGGKTSHEYETEVPIKAVPETGYHFVAWTGSISEIDDVNAAETKITMLNNYTIYPSFAKDIHTLTISADPGGSITYPSGGAGMYSYNYGTSVSIRATPATGYKFVAWTGDIDNITNSAAASTYIKMEGNYTIKATFAPK